MTVNLIAHSSRYMVTQLLIFGWSSVMAEASFQKLYNDIDIQQTSQNIKPML